MSINMILVGQDLERKWDLEIARTEFPFDSLPSLYDALNPEAGY